MKNSMIRSALSTREDRAVCPLEVDEPGPEKSKNAAELVHIQRGGSGKSVRKCFSVKERAVCIAPPCEERFSWLCLRPKKEPRASTSHKSICLAFIIWWLTSKPYRRHICVHRCWTDTVSYVLLNVYINISHGYVFKWECFKKNFLK